MYRFCIPNWSMEDPRPIGLLENDFVTNQIPYFYGQSGQIWDPILSRLIDGSFNYSMIQGVFERGGICSNSLHDNTSDIILYPSDLPVNDERIDIYGIIGQSNIEFMASYNYTDETKITDVLDSIMSFNFSLWILIIFLIFLFATLIKSRQSRTCPENLRDFMERLHQVFAHFTGQNSINEDGLKVLVITLTFFSLMIYQYYNALIHTDLVVPIIPEVPRSYEDFARTVSVIRFPNESSVLNYFKESPIEYPERKFFDEVTCRNVYAGDNIPELKAQEREPWFFFYKNLFALTKTHVSISTGLYMTTLSLMTCSAKIYSEAPELQKGIPYLKTDLAPQFKNLYPWVTSDPDTKPILHAFVKRKDFIPNKKIWKRVKSSIEHGVYQRLIWTAETLDLSETFIFPITKRATAVRNCQEYARKLKVKEVGLEALKIINFEKFILVFLAFISVCCLTYIVEVLLKERFTVVHPI